MNTMDNVSETQSNNERFEEIYRQLDELEVEGLIHGNYSSDSSEPVRQEKKEGDVKYDFYDDEKISSAIEESTRGNKKFWFPIEPEDLLELSNDELSRMIVCISALKRDLTDLY